jgi:tRNA(Glu) U13 pseudouridine synthase TruD
MRPVIVKCKDTHWCVVSSRSPAEGEEAGGEEEVEIEDQSGAGAGAGEGRKGELKPLWNVIEGLLRLRHAAHAADKRDAQTDERAEDRQVRGVQMERVVQRRGGGKRAEERWRGGSINGGEGRASIEEEAVGEEEGGLSRCGGAWRGVLLSFSLPTNSYATMAVREVHICVK